MRRTMAKFSPLLSLRIRDGCTDAAEGAIEDVVAAAPAAIGRTVQGVAGGGADTINGYWNALRTECTKPYRYRCAPSRLAMSYVSCRCPARCLRSISCSRTKPRRLSTRWCSAIRTGIRATLPRKRITTSDLPVVTRRRSNIGCPRRRLSKDKFRRASLACYQN